MSRAGSTAERGQRRGDLEAAARRGDRERDAVRAQRVEQLDRATQRPARRRELPVEHAVARLQPLRLHQVDLRADLGRRLLRQQVAAHPEAPVDPPAVDGEIDLCEGHLPGHDVRIDRVDERPVEVEDQRVHGKGSGRVATGVVKH